MKPNFYITTTLPYVNSEPHIGFAMEVIRADVIARYKRSLGYEVFFNTGTDEHGQKLYDKAKEKKIEVQNLVDANSTKFLEMLKKLNISYTNFIRTTDEHHREASQKFWELCEKNGYIYKAEYEAKYCVGCELEKQDSELDQFGRCLIHPNLEIQIIKEENWFFKFSSFQEKLLALYQENPKLVIPDFRLTEIRNFIERGLKDFSISRSREKMSWGIAVPGDETQVMYVWFDALVNYISTLGWPETKENFDKFWLQEENLKNNFSREVVQYCGKDNLRQQSAMWQAMLMAAEIPNSTRIIIDGFITGENGMKMSKSLGNTVNPEEIIQKYGADALRFFLLREVSNFEDSPFSMDLFHNAYNSGLVNGLGNLVSRVLTMSQNYNINLEQHDWDLAIKRMENDEYYKQCYSALENFNLNGAINCIWKAISWSNSRIQQEEPFKKIKTEPKKAVEVIKGLLTDLVQISTALELFLPDTSLKIQDLIKENKKPEEPLFARL